MQTSYPVFENGQVLTSRHLNDLVEYLEEQDRLTRNKLIGVGIVCGFEVDYRPQENLISISAGCAVTSEGYLVVDGDSALNQVRQYSVPIPSLEEATLEEIADARYPFFFDGEQQIPMLELLPVDHAPAPGEPDPEPVSPGLLDNKVALLFLECKRESLKNCDINDCSDKGAEIEFTLRKLLIDRSDAVKMFKREQTIAKRPADRNRHPRYLLKELRIEKINPAASGAGAFEELYSRILDIVAKLAPNLQSELQNSYVAYRYMLADLYPPADFPNGPFGDPNYFAGVLQNLSSNVVLFQYFYDYFHDMVQAYNEFLRAAVDVDAECCPHPGRLPRHVLLGVVGQQATAFAPAGTDALSGNTGVGPDPLPAALRHHFIPSPLYGRQCERLQRVRSLHLRLYMLTLRLNTGALFETQIKITPSKEGDYPLSEKALPGYYQFQFGDDLHRNWCFDKTVRNRLDQVYSYQFTDPSDHPLDDRLDDHNFYRVEGIVGRTLGDVLRELLEKKRRHGLSFVSVPVFTELKVRDDDASTGLNDQALADAQEVLRKLLLCRLRDLDVIFLILMGALFGYLVSIIRQLSGVNTSSMLGLQRLTRAAEASRAAETTAAAFVQPATLKSFLRQEDNTQTAQLLKQLRPTEYTAGFITKEMTPTDDPANSIGALYNAIKVAPSNTNLFDRTLELVGAVVPNADAKELAQKVYPTVALLDRTEELIGVVSAPALAEFDFAQFQQRYDGFVEAFESYKAQAVTDPQLIDPQIAQANQAVIGSFSAVASSGPVAVLSNLATELQERIANIFSELVLEGYAKRHPGMEHKAGVPRGGTLVLLYTRRSALTKVLKANQDKVNARFAAFEAVLLANTAAINIPRPADLVIVQPPPDDPLDDFVVLADFCLPYLCCDVECSDIELERPKTPSRPTAPPTDVVAPTPAPPRPTAPADIVTPPATPPSDRTRRVTVKGTILGAPIRPTATMRTLPSATVRLINLQTNKAVPVKVENGSFQFSALPGTYRLEAAASDAFEPLSRVIEITPETQREMEIILERQQ